MYLEWIIIAAVAVYFLKGLIIVQQAEAVIVERLGKFERELSPGLNFIFPFLNRRAAWPGNDLPPSERRNLCLYPRAHQN